MLRTTPCENSISSPPAELERVRGNRSVEEAPDQLARARRIERSELDRAAWLCCEERGACPSRAPRDAGGSEHDERDRALALRAHEALEHARAPGIHVLP